MNDNPVRGLASIIIPCWNQLEFSRKCIATLMRQTRPPWELIFVNNGSIDGTADYLAGVQDVSPMPVTIIANGTNRGFPAAINQGLQYARGEYLVLLNNDVVVTDGWLEQLVALATVGCTTEMADWNSGAMDLEVAGTDRRVFTTEGTEITEVRAGNGGDGVSAGERGDEGMGLRSRIGEGKLKIGLVGPMSNYAAPPQLVEDVPYRDLEEMKVFAAQWREEHRGKWFTVPKLSGFCLLMQRAVYDAIGGLDERFGLGFFDDDDLAERARRAGFELAVAHDLFVHHFGSRTFVGNGVDAEKLLDENAARFAVKWGNSVPRGVRVGLRAWNGAGRAVGEVRTSGSKELHSERAEAVHAISGRHGANGSGSSEALQSDPTHPTERARVSLTMIVRDEENNLPHCLESVHGLFDEIVVLDTGSQDRTIEIARSFGARVFDFVWVDDFAAARNAALARAKGRLCVLARCR